MIVKMRAVIMLAVVMTIVMVIINDCKTIVNVR